jgi:hypothetical protein
MVRLIRVVLLAIAPLTLLSASSLLCSGGDSPLMLLLQCFQEAQREESLRSEGVVLLDSTKTARQILGDLDAGRLSLREAAAALRAEHEGRPSRFRLPVHPLPGESVDECYMREIVRDAEVRLESDSSRHELLKRLRTEFQATRSHEEGRDVTSPTPQSRAKAPH